MNPRRKRNRGLELLIQRRTTRKSRADASINDTIIIFAKYQAHAEFIADRFNANYPHYKGEFARVITFKTEYAPSLIEKFFSEGQVVAYRDLRGSAGHRDRRAGSGEPGVLFSGFS